MIRHLHGVLLAGLCLAVPATQGAKVAALSSSGQEFVCREKSQTAVYQGMLVHDQGPREQIIDLLHGLAGAEDQGQLADLEKYMLANDSANQELLDRIVARCGWPTGPSSKARLDAAFLVVHHGPSTFKLKYKAHLDESYGRGELPGNSYRLFMARFSK